MIIEQYCQEQIKEEESNIERMKDRDAVGSREEEAKEEE
jgi:hypothetical protein